MEWRRKRESEVGLEGYTIATGYITRIVVIDDKGMNDFSCLVLFKILRLIKFYKHPYSHKYSFNIVFPCLINFRR